MSKKVSYEEVGLPQKLIYKRNSIKDWKVSNVDDSMLDEWIRKKYELE
jgi:hypothetical protein